MAAAPEVRVHESGAALATAVAARTVAVLGGAQTARGYASVVLTGGSILEQVIGALADASAHSDVDWARVDVYWGDERFVAADSPDRNDVPARRLLGGLTLDPARVHPMPTSDAGVDVDAGAAAYAMFLTGQVDEDHHYADDIPAFDVALIGIGPDGHCCSLFPDQPGPHEQVTSLVGVRNSPKPPPERLSLTFRALEASSQVWVIASGGGKADAVAAALSPDADPLHVPSAGARGHNRTLWLIDQDAAAKLPTP